MTLQDLVLNWLSELQTNCSRPRWTHTAPDEDGETYIYLDHNLVFNISKTRVWVRTGRGQKIPTPNHPYDLSLDAHDPDFFKKLGEALLSHLRNVHSMHDVTPFFDKPRTILQ
jgi:hypothetical protein